MEQLKTRYVFIDTNYYERHKFVFNEGKLAEFKYLFEEGALKPIVTSVVEQEVESHIKNNIVDCRAKFRKLRGIVQTLKNLEASPHLGILLKLDVDNVIEEIVDAFQRYLDESNYIRLRVNNVNAEEIMKEYFSEKGVFQGKKKSEFPDAISISALKSFVKESNDFTYVISNDPDFENVCKESDELILIKPENILDLARKNTPDLIAHDDFINEIVKKHKNDLITQIQNEIIDFNVISFHDEDDFDAEVSIDAINDVKILNSYLANWEDDASVAVLRIEMKFNATHQFTDFNESYYVRDMDSYIMELRKSVEYDHTEVFDLFVDFKHPHQLLNRSSIEKVTLPPELYLDRDCADFLSKTEEEHWG